MNVVDVAGDLYLLLAALGLCISVQYADLPILGQSAFVAVGGFGTLQLAEHGIPSKPYFPAVHLMSYYRDTFGHRAGEFPGRLRRGEHLPVAGDERGAGHRSISLG